MNSFDFLLKINGCIYACVFYYIAARAAISMNKYDFDVNFFRLFSDEIRELRCLCAILRLSRSKRKTSLKF